NVALCRSPSHPAPPRPTGPGCAASAHLDHHILTIKRNDRDDAAVAEPTTDVIQGTLDMLILKTVSLEPMHGFGIGPRIETISRGVFKVNPGSLLTALQRLERGGWLDAEWRDTPNARRARVSMLTHTGPRRID